MADQSNPNIESKRLSRRDFLKVIGMVGITTVAPKVINAIENARVEKETGVNWKKDPYSKIDFVNQPEILINSPNGEERITKDLTHLSENVDQFLKRMAVKYKDPKMAIDLEGYKVNALKLMQETIRLAGILVTTKENSFVNVIPELNKKYLEYATYLHSILLLYEAHKDDTVVKFDEVFENLPYSETLQNVLDKKSNPLINEVTPELQRFEILSHWAYQWKNLINGSVVSNPLYSHYFGYADENGIGGQGVDFTIIPNFSTQYLPRTPLNQIEKEQVNDKARPKEAIFINIDPKVQKILLEKMKIFGVERVVETINVDPEMFLAIAFSRPVRGEIFLGTPLNIETYTKYTRLVDNLLFHETFHLIEGRASGDGGIGLPELDYIEFRNLQLELIKRFDPLSDIKKLFNPKGEYVDFGKYDDLLKAINDSVSNLNEMTITDYYLQTLEGRHNRDFWGRNIKTFVDDLHTGILQITGIDLDKHFSIQDGDNTLKSIFTRLESQISSMDSFSALIAKTIIENKDEIKLRKRSTFQDEKTETEFFIKKVLPYIIAHLGLYKIDDLKKACESIDNSQYAKNYLSYWQQELNRFIRGSIPTQELSANLFSGALVDDGNNIEWGDAKDISMKMVDLLKKNGLALQATRKVV